MTVKLTPTQMAWRAAQDIQDGAYVNLGIGFPEMVAKFQPPGREAIFHTENGILGFGAAPVPGTEDWDLINAGKKSRHDQARNRVFPPRRQFCHGPGRASGCGDPWCL